VFGPVLQRHIIVVEVPVRRNGQVVYDLGMSLSPGTFYDMLLQQRLDADWTIALFDRQPVVIARIPGGEAVVGQMPSPSLHPVLIGGGEGVLASMTMEGVEVLTAFTHSSLSGWSVAIGAPKAPFTRALWHSVFLLTGFGALCLALGILLAARLAARLTRTEAVRATLINELNHRVKNTLATVQSMVVNTLNSSASVAAGRKAIEARLMAMAHTHDLLTEGHWTSADFGELLDGIVDPFRTYEARINLRGPVVKLTPRAAMTMAMVVNELATNAVKYGSLSRPEGSLRVVWAIVRECNLELTWRERGGPPCKQSATRGFGSVFMERSVRELRGSIVLEFASGGLVCAIQLPLQELSQSAE